MIEFRERAKLCVYVVSFLIDEICQVALELTKQSSKSRILTMDQIMRIVDVQFVHPGDQASQKFPFEILRCRPGEEEPAAGQSVQGSLMDKSCGHELKIDATGAVDTKKLASVLGRSCSERRERWVMLPAVAINAKRPSVALCPISDPSECFMAEHAVAQPPEIPFDQVSLKIMMKSV